MLLFETGKTGNKYGFKKYLFFSERDLFKSKDYLSWSKKSKQISKVERSVKKIISFILVASNESVVAVMITQSFIHVDPICLRLLSFVAKLIQIIVVEN